MPRHALPTARTSHREVVEHVDVDLRDRALNVRGRDVSHRHCAGGPDCRRTPTVLSLPGGTLTLAAAVVAIATLALGGAR